MKTIVINLYAGSNTGKSTCAAGLYTALKLKHENVELVQEYIKKWAWQNKRPGKYDQIYILGQQINSESILYEKVDFIITDSPILICPFYEQYLLGKGILKNTALDFIKYAESEGVHYLHFWLDRPETFNQSGRFEDKEGAMKVDKEMRKWLRDEAKINLIELPVDHNERIRLILEELSKYKTLK